MQDLINKPNNSEHLTFSDNLFQWILLVLKFMRKNQL